jgi:ubiquinone/menaquinone biosynthesis C-methylase UbiE
MDEATHTTRRYLESCRSTFWQQVFEAETNYLLRFLRPGERVLSVGCGPAHIEKNLARHGISVTGLDISPAVVAVAAQEIEAVSASAEAIPFDSDHFDAVIFIVSLQFVDDVHLALAECSRVLRPEGIFIALLLNPESTFYCEKITTPDSYVTRIKHPHTESIRTIAAQFFDLKGEYLLGIEDERIVPNLTPQNAALYALQGNVINPELKST